MIADIERFEIIEEDVREREKQARTRDGQPATYYEIEGRVEIRSRLSYALVDHNGNVLREGNIDEDRTANFKRAEYDGNYRDLDIARGTRSLFDPDRYEETIEQAEEELAKRLAQRLGQTVFDAVLDRVG